MSRNLYDKSVCRILDANVNRALEGLRVCEEMTRFILNDTALTARFKKLRHRFSVLVRLHEAVPALLGSRNSKADVGKNIVASELDRNGLPDIFFANIQRVKESVRVLEEFSKLGDLKAALQFKKIRYETYCLEKNAAEKIASLCHRRQKGLR